MSELPASPPNVADPHRAPCHKADGVPRIYFSFHYELDHWRARHIRTYPQQVGLEAAGYVDGSLAESSKILDEQLLHSRIDASLQQCAATAVLIGTRTFERRYVAYEILRSLEWRLPLNRSS
ncbi:hypothetical protein FJV41_02455 [Myxococcus llanfairpwllgwyngyllgogerychwyrndrobwllllantysiliogogogochensis]|uniref:Thoeris protein ThsB TIR-like domain-containing protein n=1 Tax=Myxococcus llanfairpwllgwyngyllgogerychwyrndrobwllllantysiliogogogochensis TaxID=2590453 RepID=A0A540X853_9BACT|nr:TIR domain-containing protein [Myxococcus llanfairpwllgwyngyllgogerychwyrndrobwllllantysiliogogogochensis]TQF17491.1 hypothetical protein FJV41_02455 [Myxococcus llanfairpwllgwyngyllgogerychwyrndrobwllllantysiliogogogochensis]